MRLEPFDRLDTHVSYFLGNDPAQWRADVPVWGGLRYQGLYPGMDLEVTAEAGRMVLRLVGYLIVGAVLAEPLANLDLWPAYLKGWLHDRRWLLLSGLGLILLGLLAQVLLTPLYQTILHNALGLNTP